MSKKEELKKLLPMRKGNWFYAKRLGISEEEVYNLRREINQELGVSNQGSKYSENSSEEEVYKVNLDKGEIEARGYYDHNPTPEEIIANHKLDITKWKLSSYWSKQKGDNKWLVSALISQIRGEEKIGVDFVELLNRYETKYKPISEKELIQNNKYSSPSCLLLSLPDLHLDKYCLDKRTAEKQCDNYSTILEKLLYKSYSSHLIEEIVFVIGNDFYHTDSLNNTTTKGTPLQVNAEWTDAYELGFDLMIKSINKLKQFCLKLHIVLVPGNHSYSKEFYLVHALENYFKSDSNITFDRTSQGLKVKQYGETLFCFNHGNNINDKLPLAFATTFHKEWGNCKYKEIILGDKHHNSERMIKSQGEAMGVRMRILPSLTGTDQWHQDSLFINAIQSGIALVYDKEQGKKSEFEERL